MKTSEHATPVYKARARRMRRAHRNVGIVLLAFLLIISATGILLNHTDDLDLAARPVPAFVAAWYYDDERPVEGFRTGDAFVYVIDNEVFLGREAVAACTGILSGAIAVDGQVVVRCGEELLVMSLTGALVERLGPVHGVPADVGRLGRQGDDLVLALTEGARAFDLGALRVTPVSGEIEWQQSAVVPASLTRQLLAGVVSWEKFVLDIHSGRVLGIGGTWLADLIALALIAMSISGLILWRLPRNGNGCDKPSGS